MELAVCGLGLLPKSLSGYLLGRYAIYCGGKGRDHIPPNVGKVSSSLRLYTTECFCREDGGERSLL